MQNIPNTTKVELMDNKPLINIRSVFQRAFQQFSFKVNDSQKFVANKDKIKSHLTRNLEYLTFKFFELLMFILFLANAIYISLSSQTFENLYLTSFLTVVQVIEIILLKKSNLQNYIMKQIEIFTFIRMQIVLTLVMEIIIMQGFNLVFIYNFWMVAIYFYLLDSYLNNLNYFQYKFISTSFQLCYLGIRSFLLQNDGMPDIKFKYSIYYFLTKENNISQEEQQKSQNSKIDYFYREDNINDEQLKAKIVCIAFSITLYILINIQFYLLESIKQQRYSILKKPKKDSKLIQFYEASLNLVSEGLVLIGQEGEVQYLNDSAKQVFQQQDSQNVKDQLLQLKIQNQTNNQENQNKLSKENKDISENKSYEQNQQYFKENDKPNHQNEVLYNVTQKDENKSIFNNNQNTILSKQQTNNQDISQMNKLNRNDTSASKNLQNGRYHTQETAQLFKENNQRTLNTKNNQNIQNNTMDQSLDQTIQHNCEISMTQDNICFINKNNKETQLANFADNDTQIKNKDNLKQISKQESNSSAQNYDFILKDYLNQVDLKNCQMLNDVLIQSFNPKKRIQIDEQEQNICIVQNNQKQQNVHQLNLIQKQKLRSQSIFLAQSSIQNGKTNGQTDLDYQIKFQTLLSNIKVNQAMPKLQQIDRQQKEEQQKQKEDVEHINVMIQSKLYQVKLFKLSKRNSLSGQQSQNKPSILFLIKEANTQNCKIKQEDSQKFQNQMLAQVFHELRTPLNCIMLMLEQLQQQISLDLYKKYLRPSINSCNLLLSLINDILDLAQINAGKFTFIFQKFRLQKLLKEIIKLLKQKAELKGINLMLDYDQSIPRYIISDPNRLRQILINLIGNSLKFTRKGHITIKTTLINTQPVRMDLQVIDTGIGIPKEKQEEIFNQFNKIQDNQNKQLNSNGCGLGLNISNQLAKGISINRQGIRVQSEVGLGSTFSFILEDKQILKQTQDYIGHYKKERGSPKKNKPSIKDFKQRKRSKSRSMISQKQIQQNNNQTQSGQNFLNQNISKFFVQQDRNVEPYQSKKSFKFINNQTKVGVGQNLSSGYVRKISSDLGIETRTNISYKKEDYNSSCSLKQINTSSKHLQDDNQKAKKTLSRINNDDDDDSLSSSSYSSSQSSSLSQQSHTIQNDVCRKSSRMSQIKSEQREKKCSIFDQLTNLSYNSIRFDQVSNLDKTIKSNSQQKLAPSMIDTSNNFSHNRKFSQLSAIVQSQQQLAKNQVKQSHKESSRFKTQVMVSKLLQFDLKERNQIIEKELTDFAYHEQLCSNNNGNDNNNNNNYNNLDNQANFNLIYPQSQDSYELPVTQQIKQSYLPIKKMSLNNENIEDAKIQSQTNRQSAQFDSLNEYNVDDVQQNLTQTTLNSDIYQKDFATQQSQNFERKSSFYKRSYSNELSQNKSKSNKDMPSEYRKKPHISKKETINMIKNFYENIKNTCNCFRVLIVDDNQFNIHALKLFLSSYFYSSIDVAFDGEQAIEKVQNYLDLSSECGCREYDLIFMDIEMPLLDGFQTSIQIHKILLEKINNPKTIIIASSANEEYQESKLKKYKIDYQIEKPVKRKQLEQVLVKWANDIKFLIAITSSLRNIEFN